jgi:hypothetical protein
MPKYRKHVVDVEAFQLTLEVFLDSRTWPWWLMDAVAPGTGPGLYPNCWAVRGIDNHIHIMDPETFATTYVEVPDA